MLRIYNTLSGQKEVFKPIEKGKVKLYACGVTVYDYCHIGHGRMFVAFDMVTRYLRSRGFEVNYVRNITDIDDKIIKRAKELGETEKDLAERFIHIMHEDEEALGVLPPTAEPRATDHIPEIIAMVTALLNEGYAYRVENGDVYYDVAKFKNYGQLSNQNIDDLKSGARVEVDQNKKSPLDFALWKAAKPGEPAWDAPWGDGRPGWHIECSVMSTMHLGNNFDIHGGGADLKFPHHENEIAQSEGALGHKVVNYWMHVGFVEIDKIKMSKSLGNFFTLRDVFKQYNPEVIRYFLIASHYRSPLNYCEDNLNSAKAALTRFYTALRDVPQMPGGFKEALPKLNKQQTIWQERFNEAMDDDFNTPEALAILFDIAKSINKSHDAGNAILLKKLGSILGILQHNPEEFLQQGTKISEDDIDKLITERNAARANKNWSEADRIRDLLTKNGIELEDGADETTWHAK